MSNWIVSCYYDTRYVNKILIHGVIEIELQVHKNRIKATIRNNSQQHYLFRFPVPGIENPDLYPQVVCPTQETRELILPKLNKIKVERRTTSKPSSVRTTRYR